MTNETIEGLERLSWLPDRDSTQNGNLIGGQKYYDVEFTGGTISNVTLENVTIDGTAEGFYLSTMKTDFSGTENAEHFSDDITAAQGKQIIVPPGEYTLNAVTITSKTVNIRFMPGSTIVPDSGGGLYRSGTMIQLTNCTTQLYDLYVDGHSNGSPIMLRADNGIFYATNTKMINVGVFSGLPSTTGVYGFLIKGTTDVRINGWYGVNFEDQPNGSFGDVPGTVRQIFLYNNKSYHLENGYSESGELGDDVDFIHFLDDQETKTQNGAITNWTFRYGAVQRRCIKWQGGYNYFSNLDIRKSDDFVPVSGSTDVGYNTLNCLDYASGITGFAVGSDSYIDASGYPVAFCNSGGTGGQIIGNNCKIIGSRLNVIRTNPETGLPQNTPTIGYYTTGNDSGSGIYYCTLYGFGRAAIPQGDFNSIVGCTFDDPRDIVWEWGTGTKNGMNASYNTVITRTAGSLATSFCARVLDVRNLTVNGNALVQAGNTTHATTFISITDVSATGYAAFNTAPSSPSTTPVSSSASGVTVVLNNNALPTINLNSVAITSDWDFGGNYAIWNTLQRYASDQSGTTQTINVFAVKDLEFRYTNASGCTVTVPDTIPKGVRWKMRQSAAGAVTVVGSGSMIIKTRGGLPVSGGLNSMMYAEITATNECTVWGDTKTLEVDTTEVGNVTTGEDNLIVMTIPANVLYEAKKGIRITAWGIGANNANAKTLKLYFGSTAMLSESLTVSQVDTWRIVSEVFSTGTDTQDYVGQFIQSGTASIIDIQKGTSAQDDGAAITVKCTGDATATNDIVQEGMMIEYLG